MPMNNAHLETTSPQNVRLVPVEPHVKSAETRKLFNAGVSDWAGSAKSADPVCYNVSTVKLGTGLFEIVETTMTPFKKGDAVWLYWDDKATGYPQMYHRPGIVTKKIHPRSFMVAFVANDPKRPVDQWTLDRRSHEHHPSELLPHDLDPGAELRRRRDLWKAEASPEMQAAWWKSEADRKRMNEELNRTLRPILARMMA